ncbi:MAG: TlpA family protein disulfide reductase [Gemmatimonadales bacterium]|nr:TlpA family protein disulfide reductase [Gemmatimonadales bacterium]
MRRQWTGVLAVIAVLALIVVILIRRAPVPIEVGRIAPDFTATDLHTGTMKSLHADYRGSVTLVNVWATWCEPCKREIPALDSLYRALGPSGLRIAAVSIDRGDSVPVRKFMDDFGVTFDVLHDPEGVIQQTYQTSGVPESFLLDRDGRIVRIVYADHPWASPSNQRIIGELLARPASGDRAP